MKTLDASRVVLSILQQDPEMRLMGVVNLVANAAASLRVLNLMLTGLARRKGYDPDIDAALEASEQILTGYTVMADEMVTEMSKYLPATQVATEPLPAIH